MINAKVFRAAAAMALVLSIAAPTASLAEYKSNNGGNIRPGGNYRPPVGPYRPGPPVAGTPAVGGNRAATPMPQPGPVVRGAERGGDNGGFRGGDHDRDRGAFVAGAAAGATIGGAAAVSPGYGYYYKPPGYFAPGYYGDDQYYVGGPAVAPAPPADDATATCMQTYTSYDPQSGTYVGDDGNLHPCP